MLPVRGEELHVGGFITEFISPRRDERLRPISGIPAAPPKSLAIGRGRRHIPFVYCNNLHYLFHEASGPVWGAAAVVAVDYKGIVLVLLRKGLFCGMVVVIFVLSKGLIDDYYLVHVV